jgi:hypothetical protein
MTTSFHGTPESTKVELVGAASASGKDASDSSTDASYDSCELNEVGQTSLTCRVRELLSVPRTGASFGVPVADTGVRKPACAIANDDDTGHANRSIVE